MNVGLSGASLKKQSTPPVFVLMYFLVLPTPCVTRSASVGELATHPFPLTSGGPLMFEFIGTFFRLCSKTVRNIEPYVDTLGIEANISYKKAQVKEKKVMKELLEAEAELGIIDMEEPKKLTA